MESSPAQEFRVSLEQEARELERRRDRLREELVDVQVQLDARLGALEHLARVRPLDPSEEAGSPVVVPHAREEAVVPDRPAVLPLGTQTAVAGKPVVVASAREGSGATRGSLREEIAALLEATGEPMNVRQLTEALGREATKGRMENVRTSTEGLVKAGRAVKTGRGLYIGAAGS